MTRLIQTTTLSLAALAVAFIGGACSGGSKGGTTTTGDGTKVVDPKPADPYATFGALEVGAEWKSYTKMNKEPVMSPTHGKRFVDTYVNDVGVAAYKDESIESMPVGSIIVKTSWETENDQPTEVAGPIFIMEKKEAGYNADTNDWYYAFHWENVPAKWQRLGTQVYWRSPSEKIKYCYECHENYERELGMVPAGQRAW